MKRCLLLGLSLFIAIGVEAKSTQSMVLHPELILNSIVQKKATEKSGDELYIAVTEFSSNGKNRQYVIPDAPMYWPDASLPQIKKLSIWQQTLKPGESSEVLVSLIEQDLSPWDVDDLIGSMKLKVKNNGGHLQYEWTLLNDASITASKKLPIKGQPKISFDFQGDSGEYALMFQMLENTMHSAGKVKKDKS